ncbi:MAG: FtsW/RodA/SpoVE family cell cycle protein [Chitinophagaceae bacterium]|nr:FtsW/RodA/SpoVE family cell cycle protein [Chitinophagaceae bacterium]
MKAKNKPAGGHLSLLLSSFVIFLLFGRLWQNLQPTLLQTEEQYKSGRAANLRKGIDPEVLKKILANGDYFSDPADIDLFADSLTTKLSVSGELPNLGSLNKQAFFITAPTRWQSKMGGADFQDRFHASLIRLGFDSLIYAQESTSPPSHPTVVAAGKGNKSISGTVEINDTPSAGILVQLKQHLASAEEDTLVEPTWYCRTDASGQFKFTGLEKDSAYSVIPLKPGFEFGRRKGTAVLSADASYNFNGNAHMIRLIGSQAFTRVKDDKSFTVRTPAEFRSSVMVLFALFLLSFWADHLFWIVRKFRADTFLLPVLMLLTGISLVILLGLQDPLRDTMHASQVLQGIVIGLVLLAVLSQVDFGKLYASWYFDWLFNFKKGSFFNLQGWTWLTFAVLLAVLTLLIGTGPEGSGVKVNLQFGGLLFQPSEITKYLLLFFFAAFFAANEQKLRDLQDLRWRFITSWTVMAAAGFILVLYLLMGDMGPALVVCFTFLIFYSLSRGNLLATMLTGITYGILLYILPAWIATVISFTGFIAYLLVRGTMKSQKWYGYLAVLTEPPLLLLLIIAAFTFGDQLPGVGERLADRKEMWLSQWNNDIYGGDHLAHSYWTLSAGGFSGQGLAKGFANTMPAAHTDMILPTIGEEIGWLGLVAIFLLYGILIHRIFLHAKRAGQPFSFYLCAGIAIATGVQFLLIAAGSVGLLPLTGVTVPFLSYGKISLIINLAAIGIVAGISARQGKEIQKEYIRRNYDPVLLTGITGFLIGILVLSGKLAWIQLWKGKEYIVKPARVIDRNGLPVFSYNPRINELAKIIGAGTIYDRNGLVLATSDPMRITKDMDSLTAAGIPSSDLIELRRKKLKRYYPFEEKLFFWVGDFNTRLFWNQDNGYFAEAEHLTTLRGFDTKPVKTDFITSRYRSDRFTKAVDKKVQLIAYDYSPLAPMLRSGIDSTDSEVKKITGKNRDVHLTVDAKLQTELQQAIAGSEFNNKRISVVVMDAASGDFLASAIYPLPDLRSPETMLLSEKERSKLNSLITERDLGMTYATAPGSTAKILTAMAAFKKMGPSAAEAGYRDISPEEIIRGRTDGEHEPYNSTSLPFIDMREAIVHSSNIYFIRLANDKSLDDELSEFYLTTGMNVHLIGGYNYQPDKSETSNLQKRKLVQFWKDSVYSVNRKFYTDPKRQGKVSRYYGEFSGLAWGQGQLTATPASMARMAGIIANKGSFQPSNYIFEKAGVRQRDTVPVKMIREKQSAEKLESFMIDQSNPKGGRSKIDGSKVAGKTGTPQRMLKNVLERDGWYVFYAPTPDKKSHTVICVRIERGGASANAVKLANTQVVPVLQKMGYLGSF